MKRSIIYLGLVATVACTLVSSGTVLAASGKVSPTPGDTRGEVVLDPDSQRLRALTQLVELTNAQPNIYAGVANDGQGGLSPVTATVYTVPGVPSPTPDVANAITHAREAGIKVNVAQQLHSLTELNAVEEQLRRLDFNSESVTTELVHFGLGLQHG